jgi:hypothetical protein
MDDCRFGRADQGRMAWGLKPGADGSRRKLGVAIWHPNKNYEGPQRCNLRGEVQSGGGGEPAPDHSRSSQRQGADDRESRPKYSSYSCGVSAGKAYQVERSFGRAWKLASFSSLSFTASGNPAELQKAFNRRVRREGQGFCSAFFAAFSANFGVKSFFRTRPLAVAQVFNPGSDPSG